MVKKRKYKKSKSKKQFNLFKGIVIFAVVSIFSWLFMTGLLEILKINTSPWLKVLEKCL